MKIVAIEGLDGVGKSTLLDSLRQRPSLAQCCFTGEFSSTVGRLLKAHPQWMSSSLIKMYLFAADRAQVLDEISSYVPLGGVVIWDRYTYSALVYREAEKRLGRSSFGWAEARQINCLFPPAAAVLFLSAPLEIILRRKAGDAVLLDQVAKCYEELWASEGVPVLRVDAKLSPGHVLQQSEGLINEALAKT